MDFIRIIRSLEEFLYEVMTWLVFYPRTLLRTALHPVRTLEYSRGEMHKPEEEQYLDTLSAPLFLMLTLVISHLVEIGAHLHPFEEGRGWAHTLLRSDQNLVIVRSLMFAIFPLMFALDEVRRKKLPLNRKSLRGPFFGECYPASVFSLLVGVGGTIAHAWRAYTPYGAALMLFAPIWYLGAQSIWRRQSGLSWGRAVFASLVCFLQATAVIIAVAVVLVLPG